MPRKAPKKTGSKPASSVAKGAGKNPLAKQPAAKALPSKPGAKKVEAPAKVAGKKEATKKVAAKGASVSAAVKPVAKKATAKKPVITKPAAKAKSSAVAVAKKSAPAAVKVAAKVVTKEVAKPLAAKKETAKAVSKTKKAKGAAAKETAALPIGGLPLSTALNQVLHGDCVAQMNRLPEGAVDLVFADPPFNIGYQYDVYQDKRKREEYLDWSKQWISGVHRALKPDGTFWLAIGDEYAAELKILAQEIGFTCRSWVIWYYTFGVNCKQKFSRSHAHLFHFVKHPKKFTFRSEAKENRIPSARQLVYNDMRSNPDGRLPDDTWILRPQDLQDCFSAEEDTWYFPRVAGTFKERAGFHGCQMPEQLLGASFGCVRTRMKL